ncbi:hypothetical protein PVAP13_3NG177220 [Panicum virgatum]|uniref:Uncharacterized protein n=1 Tax=Panicum virgatum TaxID=38727 RepID=A0A8T0TYC4_PANVG|nr:hypothetical protein PVAP13_3NG177220 [Panicum virgatum]
MHLIGPPSIYTCLGPATVQLAGGASEAGQLFRTLHSSLTLPAATPSIMWCSPALALAPSDLLSFSSIAGAGAGAPSSSTASCSAAAAGASDAGADEAASSAAASECSIAAARSASSRANASQDKLPFSFQSYHLAIV